MTTPRAASLFRVFVLAAAVLSAAGVSAKPTRRAATMRMIATAYCDRGETKSGVRAREGVVAADPRRLPIGTRVRIVSPPRVRGLYSVMDTGSKIKGRDLDIFMASCGRARRFGKRAVEVEIARSSVPRRYLIAPR
jgi:3D (Asp-Asp-Asp) domain-containing protein